MRGPVLGHRVDYAGGHSHHGSSHGSSRGSSSHGHDDGDDDEPGREEATRFRAVTPNHDPHDDGASFSGSSGPAEPGWHHAEQFRVDLHEALHHGTHTYEHEPVMAAAVMATATMPQNASSSFSAPALSAPERTVPRQRRRRLMGEDYYTMWQAKEWRNLRIHVHAGHVGLTDDPEKRSYLVHKLVPAAAAWLSRALQVVPVKGRLRLGARGQACAGLAIPSEHRSPGVAGADVIVYLSTDPTTEGDLGWAKQCFIDQYGRPTAARVNINPCYLEPAAAGKDWDRQVCTSRQLSCHGLVFCFFFFLF